MSGVSNQITNLLCSFCKQMVNFEKVLVVSLEGSCYNVIMCEKNVRKLWNEVC